MTTGNAFRLRREMTSLAALLFVSSGTVARANPVGGTVAQGGATFSSQGSQFTITTSDRAAIHWQGFNIGLGQTTTFLQPSSSSVVWNQINDPNASQILGTLNANGYVVLQNPAGFYVGGQAALNAHSLVMTTSATPAPDLSSGGAWQFNAPPPAARIINYGQINIAGAGAAFLIANQVENHGTISAPQGAIGLYAGQQVLISERPDGRGLSAKVTLPQGSVDNSGNLVADAGTLALQAQVVNQGGMLQANSLREVNGVIELVASDAVNLGAHSVLSAKGAAQGASPGGAVTIKAGNTFSDAPGSIIDVSGGAQGGQGGQVEISAASLTSIQSTIEAHAANGFIGGVLTLDPYDLTLDSAFINSLTPALNSGLYQLNLQADDNITLSALWTLSDPGAAAKLTLTAGNNITLNDRSAIVGGNNWSLNLSAGSPSATARPASGNGGIYLNGNSYIQTQNGDINLWAANDVIVNPGAAYAIGSGEVGNNGIRTLKGGNINVTARFGDVNTGGNINGYNFAQAIAPYYKVSPVLGGISTAAGGDVTINAGGNIASYLPVQTDYNSAKHDAGTGAFGSQPGNVTLAAGGDVSGHFVLANGVGTITAGGDIGAPTANDGFALSLVKGSWNVSAPNGSIYVQDVRNPNGVFDDKGSPSSFGGYHLFDYDALASLTLNAANTVEITGAGAPHYLTSIAQSVPMLFPPTLRVTAGAGGFVLGADVILFPSPQGELDITTTHGGSFKSLQNANTPFSVAVWQLAMSDSAATQWDPQPPNSDFGSFLADDHAATPPELNNPNPVVLSISGGIENVNLRVSKHAQIDVTGGNAFNFGFEGENLHSTDVTSINVAGKISYPPVYTFTTTSADIQSAEPLLTPNWDALFSFLVDPSVSLAVPAYVLGETPAQQTSYAYNNLRLSLSGTALQPGYNVNANPGFVYDSATKQLGFQYQMNQTVFNALDKTAIPVLQLDNSGNAVIQKGSDGNYYFATTTASFASPAAIEALHNQSLTSVPSAQNSSPGFQMGGPGALKLSAASLDLGSSGGIISWGICSANNAVNYASLEPWTASGASVDVTVAGDISLLSSTIASVFGGNVTVNSGGGIALSQGNFALIPTGTKVAYGIFTSGHSDVTVAAQNDIEIGGARIAAFNGGNVNLTSAHGSVNAGNGANSLLIVPVVYRDPATGLLVSGDIDSPKPFGSGVLALTPSKEYQTPGQNSIPGNINIATPQGDILSTLGGIQQYALDGNVAGGPTITLTAGTPPPKNPGDPAQHSGNVDLGLGGVVGGAISITAQGDIQGLIVSRQNANIQAAQSFSGTLLSGGLASVSASAGSISGTVVGIGGVSASGGAGVSAAVLGQNVSIGGATAQSTLGATASATTASAAAAGQANADTKQQLAKETTDAAQDDDLKKKKTKTPALVRRVSRVTVLLPPKGKS